MRKKSLFIVVLSISLLFIYIQYSQVSFANSDGNVIITGDNVNVREGAGTSYSVITQLDSGETYSLIQEDNGWFQIKLDDERTGWIAGWLAKKAETDSTSNSYETGIILVDTLNVRSEPTTNSTVINQLNKDDVVQVISQNSDWTQILLESETAWISSQYVDIQQEKSKDKEVKSIEHITTLFDKTIIREKPTSKSKSVGESKANEVFEVIEKIDDWYKIKFDNDKTGYIATWIVSDTAVPVTNPVTIDEPVQNKTIVIDAGHGGRDDGAAGSNGIHEKELTMNVATLLASKLKNFDFNVVMTRSDDTFITLEDRTYIAAINNADAFISIHFDSIEDTTVNGHTTYYYHDRDTQLSESIHQEITKVVELRDRGVRFGNYFVLRENQTPSVLLELGYISNPTEEKTINSKEYQQKVAEAIAEGITNYYSE